MFVSRAIEGLGGGGLGVTQAYVTDVTTPANRARAFGLIGATLGAGFLIGPALAGVLVRYGYRVPFAVAAGLQLITVLLTIVLLPESKGAVKTAPTLAEIRASLRSPLLGRLLLTQFTFWFSFTSWVTVFALFTERVLGYGPAQTSYLFIVSSVVTIVVQAGLIGRLVDRFGEGRIAIAGLCCAVAAYGTVFFVTHHARAVCVGRAVGAVERAAAARARRDDRRSGAGRSARHDPVGERQPQRRRVPDRAARRDRGRCA